MSLDFESFYKWSKLKLNIDLNSYKEKQLQRRITTVMNSAGCKSLEEYASLIEKDLQVRRIFLDYITINVTEFFRNKEIFDEFEQALVTRLISKFKNIKIWSAACSIGAEPYSLGIIFHRQNIIDSGKIIATDIDDTILKRAKDGTFKDHEVKNISKNELERYFRIVNDTYHVVDYIKNSVEFRKHDLLLDRYESGFHGVLCRNVTIYFKNEAKNQIYKKIYNSLVPGGILFTGATESIYNPNEFGFKKISTFLYEKI
ncbi:MAG: CheR family methyltransferase [Eubacteriales bacterium]